MLFAVLLMKNPQSERASACRFSTQRAKTILSPPVRDATHVIRAHLLVQHAERINPNAQRCPLARRQPTGRPPKVPAVGETIRAQSAIAPPDRLGSGR